MNQIMHFALPFEFGLTSRPGLSYETSRVVINAFTDEAADDIVNLLDGLCSITRLGCFSNSPDRIGRDARILPRPKLANGLWEGELSLLRVHPAFWRVFLQMCSQYHYLVTPIDRVEISMEEPDPLSIPYPSAPLVTAFQVERISIKPETPAVIRLDAESWSPENFEKVRLAFEDWGSIVFAGGFFPADVELELPQFDALKVNLLGHTRLECVVAGWRSTDAAIDAVLALCSGIHSSIQPLSCVEVE